MHGQGGRVEPQLHVIVIGAGIVGVSCASYLLRDGHRVTLLDAEGPAAGASRGNAGALSPGSCVPLALPGTFRRVPGWLVDRNGPLVIRPGHALQVAPWLLRLVAASRPRRVAVISDALRALHRRTFECYRPLLENAGATGLVRQSGALVVYRSRAAFERSQREWHMRAERGAPFETLDAGALHELVPALSAAVGFGVLQPEHGFVTDPERLVQTLADQFLRDGGAFTRARVTALEPGTRGAPEITTDTGPLRADRVVVATGAWSRPLAAAAGSPVPLETQRGYHVSLPEPGIELEVPVSSAEGKFYATPMRGGIRLAGTVEFAGLTAPPNFVRARGLIPQARTLFPALQSGGHTEWMGHRPCLPDSLPVIGPSALSPDILLAFGHGHNGMTSGPVTGRLIADLVAGRPPFLDLASYRPGRFSLGG